MATEKKKSETRRSLISKYQENCNRISEIADLCESENRERNEVEDTEYKDLLRSNQLIEMRMREDAVDYAKSNPNAESEAISLLRENAKKGAKSEIVFVRDIMTVSDIKGGAVIPLSVQTIMQPLTEGFILDKVGLPMLSGLVGDFVWPMYEMVEASVLGEGVALSDSKIPFSKMTATPERIGIAIPVTNQALNQSDGLLQTIIRQIMPMAIRQLLNKILFSTTKVNNATNLKGPFVDKVATAVSLSAVPTFKEFNAKMKAAILETGIDGEHMCWIMTKSLQAILEGTPINEKGIYIPMIQNGMLCGLPVYTSNIMRVTDAGVTTEYVGLGDWRYQPMGLFGTLRFIVDPYSQARKDSVDFVLNADYATKTLRSEAFLLGKLANA